jgi:hypothetical protein
MHGSSIGKLAIVLGLALFIWLGVGERSIFIGTALLACAAGSLLLARASSDRLRALAPLPPALFLLDRAVGYAAAPQVRPEFGAAMLGSVALVLHFGLALSLRDSKSGRVAAGLCLSLAVFSFAFAAADWIYSRHQPLDLYEIAPIESGSMRGAFLHDKKLGVVFRPGFRGRFAHPEYHHELVEINNAGYRDRDWPVRPDPGTVGVLLLGDSTLFGLGVDREETIAARLEALLVARRPGTAYHAYNTGVPSYGPRQELVVLRRVADRIHPRVCIVYFYDGNDLEDCRRQFVETRAAGFHSDRLRSEDVEHGGVFRPPNLTSAESHRIPPLWTRTYWARYSSLFRDLDMKISSRIVGLGLAPVDFVYNHEFLRSMQREPDLGIQDDLELAEDALHEIAEECARRGIVFALVRLPGSIQCEPSTFLDMLKDIGQDPARFDRREPGASIVADARSRGVPACDLLPVLQVPEGERSACYFREGHPNRAGNARIAQATLQLLDENDAPARALELRESEKGR